MYDALKDKFPDMFDGSVAGIFVDDTGSPGLNNTPSHLKKDRKTWVSVLVLANQMPEIMEQIPNAIVGLTEITGASEFHFADIFGGRREFKSVAPAKRIGVFKFMAWVFNRHRFPIHVQTFDPESEAFIEAKRTLGNHRVGRLDLSNHEHFALYFLLYLTHGYFRKNHPRMLARVFVDEGIYSHGQGFKVPGFNPEFKDDLLCFSNSKFVMPIQLADFAAFCLNRQQLLLGKSELSDADWQFLEVCTEANFNLINIPKVATSKKLWSIGH